VQEGKLLLFLCASDQTLLTVCVLILTMATSSLLVAAIQYAASNVYVLVLGSLFLALLSWRLWRFTIHPMLWPDEPRTLPYTFPIIGHTYKFMTHAEGVLDEGR
jgi:hypothetical protein